MIQKKKQKNKDFKMERYNFLQIEKKWRGNKLAVNVKNKDYKKYYCLEMFPYPLERYTWDMLEIIL